MYSFYGGQKGKDFRITKIFPNRSAGLLQDLQARWYSPVNVGDYVFINYGDIAEQDKFITNENGVSDEVQSNYSKNLDIDLKRCGKSYNNSIWQKIYIDENKQVSPDFPDSEENVFVFINFDEVEPIDASLTSKNLGYYGQEIKTDLITGEIYYIEMDEQGNIVYDEHGNPNHISAEGLQIPGYSLKETSQIYSEENYGFGYRLICCLTGQTPRIQVYHQTIDIDDGDPYVTLDLSNLEKPKIKFYLHKAQTFNEYVSTIILNPLEYPDANIITDGTVSSIRFRKGDIISKQFQPQIDVYEREWVLDNGQYAYYNKIGQKVIVDSISKVNNSDIFNIEDYAIKMANEDWYVTNTLPVTLTFNVEATLQNPVLEFELPRAVRFFNGYLFGQGNIGGMPFYIANETLWNRQQKYTLTYEKLNCVYNIALATTSAINISELTKNNYKYLLVDKFTTNFIANVEKNKVLIPYYNNDKSLLDILANATADTLIPWNVYGIEKANMNNNETVLDFIQRVYENLEHNVNTITQYQNGDIVNLHDLTWGLYGLIPENSYEGLLDKNTKQIYLENYVDGLINPGSMVPLLSLIDTYTPLLDFKGTILDIFNTKDTNEYYFKPTHGMYFQNLAINFGWVKYAYYYLISEALPGDIYIHNPTGRLYSITEVINTDNGFENSSISVIYSGILTAPAPEIEQTIQPTFIKDEDGNYIHNQINIRDNLLIASNNEGQREQYIFDIPASPEFQTSNESIINELPPEVVKTIVENEDGTDGIYNLHFKLPRAVHIYSDDYLPETGEITGFNDNGDGNPITTISDSNDNLSKGDIYIHTAYIKDPPGYDLSDNHRGYVYIYNGDGTWTRQGSILGPIGVPEPVNRIILQAVYSGQDEGTYSIVNENNETNTYTYWVNINDILTEEKLTNLVSIITADWQIPEPGQGPSVGKTYPKSYYGEMTQVLVLTALAKVDDEVTTDTIENDLQPEATYWAQWNNDQKKWYLTIMTSVGSWLSNNYIEDDIAAKSMTYSAYYLNSVLQWDTENYY